MNRKYPLRLPLALLVLCTGFSAPLSAQQSTVNFSGEIQAQACSGGSIQGGNTVKLPTLPTGSFTAQQRTAGETLFAFALTGCPVDPARRIRVGFWSANATPEGRLANPAGSNVQVELLAAATAGGSAAGTRIMVGTTTAVINTNDPGVLAATSTLTVNYFARYYANVLPVTAGPVNIPAQWIVYY